MIPPAMIRHCLLSTSSLCASLALSIASLAPGAASAQAQTPPAAQTPATAQTPIAIVSPAEQDLGIIGLGTEPEVTFAIRNDGAAPLTLDVLSVAKGLKLANADSPIAPGAAGAVRFAVDTFKAGQTTQWKVSVATNDPAHRVVELVVRADVRQFLALAPDAARISFVQYGKEGGTSHVLAALDESPMELQGVESPFDYITATSRELKGADRLPDFTGRQWRIDLKIATNAPVGPIGGYVILRTTHPKQPRAFLSVTGFVRPLFAVTPAVVKLPAAGPVDGGGPLMTLVVKNFGEAALKVTRVSTDVAGLTTTLLQVDEGHVWRVELRMSGDAEKGPFTGTLRLATSSARMPEVVVPIEGVRTGGAP
jgi:hypothetical protein